jgi:predicted AlkP superfamily phosphohydrolase/phosphomutase
LSQKKDWDLFFIFLDALDIVQHRLWSFSDEKDPAYPGPTPLQDSILRFYRLLDDIVGKFIALHPDAVTLIFSDHGHGIRPPQTVNLNEVLRREGLLVSRGGKYNPLPYLMEGAKNGLLNFTRRFGLDSLLVSLATKTKGLSSLSKNIYMSTAYLDRPKTVAYLSSFAGIKSYSHGGVEISRQNLAGRDYEEVRSRIIQVFSGLKEPQSGETMLEWVCRREELYQGARVAQAYPDLVFELKEGYGTGWGIHTRLIGRARDHQLAPGGHKKNAVFLLNGPLEKPARPDITLMDIAPTVLDLLEVKGEFQFDGKSIFRS